jgi:hypothetical protein
MTGFCLRASEASLSFFCFVFQFIFGESVKFLDNIVNFGRLLLMRGTTAPFAKGVLVLF